ncbi:MAG: hypothetical protein RR581_07770 [Eubacterium sp.]
MKKRASLLISGITTAALIVTAIGSFAAWDKITGDKNELSVKTSTPVNLSVAKDETGLTGRLVPTGAQIIGNDKDVLTATFTPTFTVAEGETLKYDIEFSEPVVKVDNIVNSADYDVKIYKSVSEAKTVVPTSEKLVSGITYTAEIKFKASGDDVSWTPETVKVASDKAVKVQIDLKAVAKP